MSVAINTFNSCRRGYPADEGAHIALRMFISKCCYSLTLYMLLLIKWLTQMLTDVKYMCMLIYRTCSEHLGEQITCHWRRPCFTNGNMILQEQSGVFWSTILTM